jgi:hypothetical protein
MREHGRSPDRLLGLAAVGSAIAMRNECIGASIKEARLLAQIVVEIKMGVVKRVRASR